VIICVLLLGVSIITLGIRVAQRRPYRNWVIVAMASVILMATFGGIWDIVHGGGNPSSGRGGGSEKADSASLDDGGDYPSARSSLRPFDKDADFNQSYEEADGYLRAAQLNVPEHEVPAAAVAACRILTFARKTETSQALVEDQIDSIYNQLGATNYLRAVGLARLPQYEEKCDRVWAWYRVYREASW